jgi:hypothetical protein
MRATVILPRAEGPPRTAPLPRTCRGKKYAKKVELETDNQEGGQEPTRLAREDAPCWPQDQRIAPIGDL